MSTSPVQSRGELFELFKHTIEGTYDELAEEQELGYKQNMLKTFLIESNVQADELGNYVDIQDDREIDEYLPDEGIAVVHFDEEGPALEIVSLAEYGFEEASLQDAFPVGLDDGQRIPTDYFPFDTEDDNHQQFSISILQSTVHVALEKLEPQTEDDEIHLTADELLEDAHPLWVEIDDDKKQAFRSHTEDIISAYSRHGLREHIKKVESSGRKEWRVVSKSLQALQRKVAEFVEAMETEMAQTELDDFTDK